MCACHESNASQLLSREYGWCPRNSRNPELIASAVDGADSADAAKSRGKKTIAARYIADVFGIELAGAETRRLPIREQPVPDTGPSAQDTEWSKTESASERSAPEFAVRGLAASAPWGNHVELMKKFKDPNARIYYLRATAQLGWTRAILVNQIIIDS